MRLNIYDITNVASTSYADAVVRMNSITREVGLGGVFHGAIDVYGVEWSYGFCQSGTGVRASEVPPELNYATTKPKASACAEEIGQDRR